MAVGEIKEEEEELLVGSEDPRDVRGDLGRPHRDLSKKTMVTDPELQRAGQQPDVQPVWRGGDPGLLLGALVQLPGGGSHGAGSLQRNLNLPGQPPG